MHKHNLPQNNCTRKFIIIHEQLLARLPIPIKQVEKASFCTFSPNLHSIIYIIDTVSIISTTQKNQVRINSITFFLNHEKHSNKQVSLIKTKIYHDISQNNQTESISQIRLPSSYNFKTEEAPKMNWNTTRTQKIRPLNHKHT